MIIDYFIKNLKDSQEYLCKDIRVIIEIKKDKLTLFKNKKYWISIIIIDENEVTRDIKNICDFLIEKFLEKSYPNIKLSIDSNWYIFSNVVSKDIYYKINIKENIRYKNMINRFALINNINGEIFFNPDKIENNVLSARMKFIYNNYQTEYPLNEEKEKLFSKEITDIFEVLEIILNDK
ncbi:MAG: hypothetical protein LBI28_13740 [Treponema sp.]|jgi:hypothetical protein|nr:hypothetical protein [Treponema sp.]